MQRLLSVKFESRGGKLEPKSVGMLCPISTPDFFLGGEEVEATACMHDTLYIVY